MLYMQASGASKLWKLSHFHIVKLIFLQYFVGTSDIFRYKCTTDNFQMYCWQNSEKALLGEGKSPPPPPPGYTSACTVPHWYATCHTHESGAKHAKRVPRRSALVRFPPERLNACKENHPGMVRLGTALQCFHFSRNSEFSGIFGIFKDIIFFSRIKTNRELVASCTIDI